MKRKYLIILPIIFSSCASIINNEAVDVRIITNVPAKVVLESDTISTNYNNEATFYIHRSREPIKIHVFDDSLTKEIVVPSRNSFAYWLNLYPSTAWIGFLIDRKNPKRYTYPSPLYVNLADKSRGYTLDNEFSRQQGKWEMCLSFPYINSFLIKPYGEGYKSSTGFLGIALGADYYYKDDRFVNLTVRGVLNHLIPIPVGIDQLGGHFEDFSSADLGITNNFRIKRFSVGYGLSYSKIRWRLQEIDTEDLSMIDYKLKRYDAMGLIFPLYYQIGKKFYAGVVYRPSFLQLNMPPSFNYEHIISIDFGWRYPLDKKK